MDGKQQGGGGWCQPGVEPWQYYGPSTAAGEKIYLFALAEPVETVTVRSVPVRRVKSVCLLGSGTELPFSYRTTLDDRYLSDPLGELSIDVTGLEKGTLVPVFVIELEPIAPVHVDA